MRAPATSSSADGTAAPLVCPDCAKVLDGEPNFCPACGADLRGMTGSSDTLDGTGTTLIDGRYRILEKLGEGGMGSVFKVEHVRMGKIAALKLLRPDHAVDRKLKARFLQEAQVVARLSHPSTVQVFDAGELPDGGLFITMEYVAGKDLAWHLKAHGAMSEARAISIGIQVLASLQEAHEAGIIHRDIKPANVMLVRRRKGGEDHIKLLDFGIAKLQEAEGRKSTTGDFVGTPAYMSPEQIRGEDVDARADLYSLGALLFELVTGRQLFVGPTPLSVLTYHVDAPVPSLAEVAPTVTVSPAFEAILRRALEKEPARRFADADSMRQALEQLGSTLGTRPVEVTPGTPSELKGRVLSREDFDRFERQLRRRRALTPLVAVAAITLMGAGTWRLLSAPPAVIEAPGEEREPNDAPQVATPLSPGKPVSGTIGAPSSVDLGDRDLYRATVPGGPVRLVLGGVPDLNLVLEVLQFERDGTSERLRRKVFLDDVGLGDGERLDGLKLEPGEVYLRVEERPFVTEPNRPPRERARSPYSLRLELMEPGSVELEPNDTPGTAQLLPQGAALTAFLGPRLDPAVLTGVARPDAPFTAVDHFRVDGEVVVAVVPPPRGVVEVMVGEDPRSRVEVSQAPAFLQLGPGGADRFRVTAGRDTIAGDAYFLAVGSTGAGGVEALLDLARLLRDQGRDATRTLVLEGAASRLARSPEASRLRAP